MNIYLEIFCLLCILFIVFDWWRKWFRYRHIIRRLRVIRTQTYEPDTLIMVEEIATMLGVNLDGND